MRTSRLLVAAALFFCVSGGRLVFAAPHGESADRSGGDAQRSTAASKKPVDGAAAKAMTKTERKDNSPKVKQNLKVTCEEDCGHTSPVKPGEANVNTTNKAKTKTSK